MTALQLLTYIVMALLMQLTLGISIVVWRRRMASSQLSLPPPEVLSKPEIGAWRGWREFRVSRRVFEDTARSQCSFYLSPVDGVPLPAFLPGQFLTFSIPASKTDSGRGGEGSIEGGSLNATATSITRCYSLSDCPDPLRYRVTIKRAPAPVGLTALPPGLSSTYFHDHVQQGDVLNVKAPAGRFIIDTDASVPAVFIAGGIGITPMLSMLRWCINEQPRRTLYLYYGVQNRSCHAFKQVLEQMAAAHPTFHLNVIYGQADSDDEVGKDYQHVGRIDIALLRRTLPHGRHQFYVCGPSAMMESLVPALVNWGVPPGDVHFEAFGPASVKLPASTPGVVSNANATSFDIKFSRSDRTLVWDGQDANLLDFTDRNGLAIESGCRAGSCGTCETRLVSGSVHYDHQPDYNITPGHCLLCVGRPTSPLVLEA